MSELVKPVNLGKVVYRYSASSQAFVLNIFLFGFGLELIFYTILGPLENVLHISSVIILAFLLIEVAIIKEKRILSFSKSPRVTFLYIYLVILSIKFTKRPSTFWLFSAISIEYLNNFWTYCSEYWYILSMRDRSLIIKKRMAPLVATEVYCWRIYATLISIFLLWIIFYLIYKAASCEFCNVSISYISSRIVSDFAFFKSLSILSSL